MNQLAPIFSFVALITFLAPGTLAQQPYGLTSRPTVGAFFDNAVPSETPAPPTAYSTSIAFPNLTFQNAIGVLPMPGTNKLVVWEREGRVYEFDNTQSTNTKTLSIDVSNQCQGWDDCGLLALAFHPNFVNNRYVYIYYAWKAPGTITGDASHRPTGFPNVTMRNRLSRFTLDANGVAVPGSEYILFDQNSYSTWHHGGGMFFHPVNGFLYLTTGDDTYEGTQGDNVNDPNHPPNDQVVNKGFFSGVIRIDVDKTGGSVSHAPTRRPTDEVGPNWPNSYFVPNSNPLVGTPNVLEEYVAIGLRSPHRMTIDPVTNRIFIGDVGQSTYEEVNVIEPADTGLDNFQWSKIEGPGTPAFPGPNLTPPYLGVDKPPVYYYNHNTGNKCIIGGYVYRGSAIPALIGKYIFADNTSQKIFLLDESTSPATATLLATIPLGAGPNSGSNYTSISSFGFDQNNELLICQMSSLGGYIYKLLGSGGAGSTPMPTTLSQVGVFSNMAALTPSTKLVPFSINVPFWSDSAIKSRWAAIPNGTAVNFASTGNWDFPGGTVMVKHFDFPIDDANPANRRRLETRLIVKKQSGSVYGATYKWREDNTNADVLNSSLNEDVGIFTANSWSPAASMVGQNIGVPSPSGTMTRTGDFVSINVGGRDMFNTEEFFFYHLDDGHKRVGDFDICTQVTKLTKNGSDTAKAALMVRETLNPPTGGISSMYAAAIAYPAVTTAVRQFNFEYRTAPDQSAGSNDTPTINATYPDNTWLRLRRVGNTFIGYAGNYGRAWTELGRITIPTMPSAVYLGLGVTSHSNGKAVTAEFNLKPEMRNQVWYYPDRTDCLQCHLDSSGGFLGPKTRQLNMDYLYSGGVTDNQIRSWNHVGLFQNGPLESDISSFDHLAPASDGTASLEKRAKSYVDANCSYCHNPAGVPVVWDARYDVPLPFQGIINGSVANNIGISGAKVVLPHDLSKSVLYQRVNTVGTNQMPPLARNTIDTTGANMLSQWIQSLSSSVTLNGTSDGSQYLGSDNVSLTVSDPGSQATRVEFYDGTTRIADLSNTPFTYTWTNPLTTGNHTIRAVAYGSNGSVVNTVAAQVAVFPLRLDMNSVTQQGPSTLDIRLGTTLPSGRSYTVESSEDLINWQTVASDVGTGQPVTIQDLSPNTPQRFYRMTVSP